MTSETIQQILQRMRASYRCVQANQLRRQVWDSCEHWEGEPTLEQVARRNADQAYQAANKQLDEHLRTCEVCGGGR